MPKGTIKADVMFRLDGWIKETEAPILSLVGSENELPVETAIIGTIEVSATRLYQIMKAQKEDGKLPLFRMVVIDPDAQMKKAELEKQKKEDENSPKLDLGKKEDKKPPNVAAAASKDAAVKKFVDKVPKA